MPLNQRELQKLHDRSVLGPHYQRALQEYDPDLLIAWNRLEDRYEVWREEWDDRRREVIPQIIARGPRGKTRIDIAEVIAGLRARDTHVQGQSHQKMMDQYLRDLEKEAADKDYKMEQALAPIHERFVWQVAKETGNLSKFMGFTPKPKAG